MLDEIRLPTLGVPAGAEGFQFLLRLATAEQGLSNLLKML